MKKTQLLMAKLTIVLGLAEGACLGQSIQGVTDIFYDAGRNVVVTVAQTWGDYATGVYYDLQMSTDVYAAGSYLGGSYVSGSSYASTIVERVAQPGLEYTATSTHAATASYLLRDFVSFCGWNCNDPYDIYGYRLVSNTPSVPNWSSWVWAASASAGGTVLYSQIYLGPTQKKTTTPGGPNPTFRIRNTSFIPWAFVYVNPARTCALPPPYPPNTNIILTYKGEPRWFSPNSGEFRTVNIAQALVGSGTLQSGFGEAGMSYSFAGQPPLDSSGWIAAQAYDGVNGDCILQHESGRASSSGMSVTSFRTGPNQMQVAFTGGAGNPLSGESPNIDWSFQIGLNALNPTAPRFTLSYNHDCFPAHELWIGNQQIHGYIPPSNDFVTVLACLSGFGQIAGSNISGPIY